VDLDLIYNSDQLKEYEIYLCGARDLSYSILISLIFYVTDVSAAIYNYLPLVKYIDGLTVVILPVDNLKFLDFLNCFYLFYLYIDYYLISVSHQDVYVGISKDFIFLTKEGFNLLAEAEGLTPIDFCIVDNNYVYKDAILLLNCDNIYIINNGSITFNSLNNHFHFLIDLHNDILKCNPIDETKPNINIMNVVNCLNKCIT